MLEINKRMLCSVVNSGKLGLNAGVMVAFMAFLMITTGCAAEKEVQGDNDSRSARNSESVSSGNKVFAFPGAEGYGRFTKGGRGGDVYHVINLKDSGPGSLRYGIETADGPRTIVFRVAGTITLESELIIDKSYLTIAGQTAPGGGITLRNYEVATRADHLIMRYIRVRVGDQTDFSAGGTDAISIGPGTNIILDHISASWGNDETVSSNNREIDSLTVQWSIIAESLHNSLHPKGPHGYGGLLGGRRVSYHYNLHAHHMRRMPAVAHGYFVETDYRYNVIYNWGNLSSYGWVGTNAHANWVKNYYKPGPATRPNVHRQIFRFDRPRVEIEPDIENLFYIDGNFMEGYPEISADNWAGGIDYATGTNEETHRVNQPFDLPRPEAELTVREVYEKVLASAGASIARDPVDARIVNDVLTGSYTYGNHGFIDSQDEVGGWPYIRPMGSPADSDRDGMPDWWEEANSLDPRDDADGNNDRTGDGYTNLEEYLSWLSNPEGRFMENYPAGKFGISGADAPRELFD